MQTLHPRIAVYRRFWESQRETLRDLRLGRQTGYRPRAGDPMWIDYFPWAMGTVPEKMVFAELARRGITFYFAPYWGDMPFTQDIYEHYRPDFILPEYRIVIEVYGSYWHRLPGQAEADARKAILYEASGYRYVHLWDVEIFAGVKELIDQKIPELKEAPIRTAQILISDRPQDPRASIRSQRRSRPKVVRQRVKLPGPRKTKAPLAVSYPHLRPPRKDLPKLTAGFQGFPDEDLAGVRQYAQQWRDYIEELGKFFSRGPKRYKVPVKWAYRPEVGDWVAVKWKYVYGPSPAEQHPELYRYWMRWRGYWTRWQDAMKVSANWFTWIAQLGRYFKQYPTARQSYLAQYYSWLAWRRMHYRRL